MGMYGEKSAYFYANGPWPGFSSKMAKLMPGVLERFRAEPRGILDVACGVGTFAVAVAKNGFDVMGVDVSPHMVALAKQYALAEGADVDFAVEDMRYLTFEGGFDLVTCWYDSVNYLLERSDVEQTFAGVFRALNPGGLFVFDMNTIYGLAASWQRYPCYVEQNTDELFQIICPEYGFVRNIATLKVVGFMKQGDGWARMEEQHKERGYTLKEIRQCLEKVGLEELACWGSIDEKTAPRLDSDRVWVVARKSG